MTDARTKISRRAFLICGLAVSSGVNAGLISMAGPKYYPAEESEPETFDFYISTSGSDSNNGLTTGTPWAITGINSKRATYAGTRVGLMDGTYPTGAMTNSDGGNTPALTVAAGTLGSPTIIQAVNDRMAILDDDGVTEVIRPNHGGIIGCVADDVDCSYIEMRGLKFINSRMHAVFMYCTDGRGVGFKVVDCEFADGEGDSADNTAYIFLQAFDDTEVTNCYLHDLTNSAQAESTSMIECYGCQRLVVDLCTFRDGSCGGVHSKYAGGTPRIDDQQTHVKRCYFENFDMACRGWDNKDQSGPGPSDHPYPSAIIENNVFVNCVSALGNDGPYSAANPLIARNNTFVSTSAQGIQGWNLHALDADCRPYYYNNILSVGGTSTYADLKMIGMSVDGSGNVLANVLDYNCYQGTFAGTTNAGYGYPHSAGPTDRNQAAWLSQTGEEAGSLFATDPEFLMTGTDAEQYQIDSGSPCWNAGREGGLSAGATRHIGAWDGVVTQIGHDFS